MALYLGNTKLSDKEKEIKGEVVNVGGEEYYKISNYSEMPPFFISISSSSDHWMFLSSNGGLTCGRKDPENALFPYYTDDKIHDSVANTGPKSILIVTQGDKSSIWEPFQSQMQVYHTERNIYRSIIGNKIIFEEINHDLEISFSYSWLNSDKFGFVKETKLFNRGEEAVQVNIVDGMRNILPYGVNRGLQTNMSTLVDGYKQSELIEAAGLGIFTLSSILTDKAEPSEALKATTVWQSGLTHADYLLSERQLMNFLKGKSLETETFKKGQRGAFFIHASEQLNPQKEITWYLVAEINLGPSDIPALISKIEAGDLMDEVKKDIDLGTARLRDLVAQADGQQLTADKLNTSRHFSNTLYNIMRGGIFNEQYTIGKSDFIGFIKTWNALVFERHRMYLEKLDEKTSLQVLKGGIAELNDPDLERLLMEYLPLTFSRRHGDPSRPWNVFSIQIKKEDGTENLYFQGNWRDIFQNWEALSLSYPEYIESFIAKFLNASTADGFNPYRVTKDGIDWELLDPDDPWSNIGYWGDHQIIYLQKLLELSFKYHPQKLGELLEEELFVYANVPYKLKGYDALVSDPRNSISFNGALANKLEDQFAQLGADGKMHLGKDGLPYKVSMVEKLMATALSKLSNFIPEGGIWMNTQRPEWNDANNALVGYGVSMVTLYYMRRFFSFIQELIGKQDSVHEFKISEEVIALLQNISSVFKAHQGELKGEINNVIRKEIVDGLGAAGEQYRNKVYDRLTYTKKGLSREDIMGFLALSLEYIDHSIKANKRHDGLYNAYNLVHFNSDGYEIEHLYEMLEGQVAVLSSGLLTIDESIALLDALRASKIYRKDQNSYMLYPDRSLARFLEKNCIPKQKAEASSWVQRELKFERTGFIEKDLHGNIHFNGVFKNSEDLRLALQKDISMPYDDINEACKLFEDIFKHKQFTGRSGTFYKYEGLGSIYWHMVSKLLLAVQELWQKAEKENASRQILNKIKHMYFDIKDGIGVHKKPEQYGAFPTEPYSHTPSFAGVQQPGMTGQVKEDIISRFGEFGVKVQEGQIHFDSSLLDKTEFLDMPQNWTFIRNGQEETIELPEKALGFSLCGIPVIYELNRAIGITVVRKDSGEVNIEANILPVEISKEIFSRSEDISRIFVRI